MSKLLQELQPLLLQPQPLLERLLHELHELQLLQPQQRFQEFVLKRFLSVFRSTSHGQQELQPLLQPQPLLFPNGEELEKALILLLFGQLHELQELQELHGLQELHVLHIK